jgi:acetyl esterase/lipase
MCLEQRQQELETVTDEVSENEQPGNPGARSRLGESRRRWVILFAAVVSLILLASSTHVRVALKSGAFLVEVFPDAPAYPGRWVADDPERVLVQFSHEDSKQGAFYYRPAGDSCHSAIVMYIGLGPEHGDQHLDRISRAFARNGTGVLIPVSEPMVAYRLDGYEHRIAVSAFDYLQRRQDVDPNRVGLFGISVGGAIVANAAQQPEINRDVAMVHSLGGYYDALTVLVHMSLQAYEVEGEWIDWEPSPTTYRATRNSILPLMPSDDRSALASLFDPEADTMPDGLGRESESLARLLVNRDPDRAAELRADLPEDLLTFLDEISPASRLDELFGDTYLLHDQFDHVLPYSESIRFAQDAKRAERARVYLTITEQFHHVRPDEEGDRLSLFGDGVRLYRHIYRMHQSLDGRGWVTSPLNLLPGIGTHGDC